MPHLAHATAIAACAALTGRVGGRPAADDPLALRGT